MVDVPAQDPERPLMSLRGQHSRTLDELGAAICRGDLVTQQVITLGEIEQRFAVSRSVARETIRVLEAMRLVVSRRRVGVVVLPVREWNLFDPQVIRWRLASPDRVGQLEALVELRAAIESDAARLAALRAAPSQVSHLIGLSGRLWAAGQEDDGEAFLDLDVQFHSLVLESSGNPMFARLESLVGVTLVGRAEAGLVPARPDPQALQLHLDLATAIQRREPDVAYSTMRSILLNAQSEMEVLAARPASTEPDLVTT